VHAIVSDHALLLLLLLLLQAQRAPRVCTPS
jgi:hypothetical protein